MTDTATQNDFPELAKPMSVRAHHYLSSVLRGQQATREGESIKLRVEYGPSHAHHANFQNYLSACFKNRGWDCDVTPVDDFTAEVTFTSDKDKLMAARMGVSFPGSERLAVGGVYIGTTPEGEVGLSR